MYVSVTGLKNRGFIGRVRFWVVAIPAFRAGKKAEGCLFCETKTLNGYHHTLTVWVDKNSMIKYRDSKFHLNAMRIFPKIAYGKVYGCEITSFPTWSDALKFFNDYARDV